MGPFYKQSAPSAAQEVILLYTTVPKTKLNCLQVCNLSEVQTDADSFSVAVCGRVEATVNKNYIYKGIMIHGGDSYSMELGQGEPIILPIGTTVRVRSAGGNIAFTLFGEEL